LHLWSPCLLGPTGNLTLAGAVEWFLPQALK
jgi:hypothetical protein